VANLPYNVATPVLFGLLACPHVGDALLMVQAEVGERWTAAPGETRFGAVSLKVAALADAGVAFRVPSTVFLPAPRVDSVMVSVRRRDGVRAAATDRLLAVIDDCFVQPRKTLRNNLLVNHPPELVDQALEQAALDPSMRPGRLSLADAERLATVLSGA
jgi:16S rRNA (adenine1518-N6/adenine1519-N6)-dimethyltransferase